MQNKIILIVLLAISGQVLAQGGAPSQTTPSGVQIPSGVTIPDNVQLPEGVTIPDNVQLPEGVNIPNGVQVPQDVTIPDEITDEVIKEIEPKEIEKDKDVDEKILEEEVLFPPVGIFGHDYLRKSDFELYDQSNEVKIEDDYVLGSGDNLTISIWNKEDVENINFTIEKNGYVELGSIVDPFTGQAKKKGIGRLYLSGVTFGKAKRMLKSKYRGAYEFKDEDFDVSLTGAKNINIDIIGQVEQPGPYKLPAINTIYNVIKLSGGPTVNGSVRNIQVKRNGQTIHTLDVYKYLLDGETRQNIYLQDNDVIFVPPIGKLVEASGAVVRPMKFELRPNENFANLIEYMGGFQPDAMTNTLQLYRFENDEYVLKSVSFNKQQPNSFSEKLLNGDYIVVDRISDEFVSNAVYIIGAVNKYGEYGYSEGMKVSDLIAQANGLKYDAVTTRAYLIRLNDELQPVNIPIQLDEIIKDETSKENIAIYPRDQLRILSKAEFASEFKVEIFGQVRKPGNYTFGNTLTLQDILIMSGGFKTAALTSEVEIRRVISYNEVDNRLEPVRSTVKTLTVDYNFLGSDNPDNQYEIMPMDQIFVRSIPEFERPQIVDVKGEVKYPGSYPLLSKNMRVSDLLQDAGGLTPYSYPPGARFYRLRDTLVVVKDTVNLKNGKVKIKDKKEIQKVERLHLLDLENIMRNKNSKYNYVLKPGDSLVIPTVDETVSITGAIRNKVKHENIVHTAYRGSKNAKWYVNEYGAGFDTGAWKKTTQVVYPNGHSKGTRKFLFFNVYPKVEPGSDITVSYKPVKDEKNEKSRFFEGITAEKSIALLTSVGGIFGLILATKR